MASAWSQWRALPGRERRVLAALVALLPVIHLGLRALGYKRTRSLVESLSAVPATDGGTATTPDTMRWAQRVAELANIAGRRGVVDATCLRQSLAVLFLLRREGMRPELKLGVDRVGAMPDMHAWVELDGIRLGQADSRHRAFR